MTLKNFLRALGRRWYVLLVGLLVTGVACGVVASEVQPTYQRSASLLLMPAISTIPEGGNAYLYLGGLGQASEVLVNTMGAQTVREPLLAGHPGADVAVQRNVTSSGPLLSVTATGSSDSEVAEVLERALAAVESNLKILQTRAAVPEDARISSLSLTTDEASTVLQRSRLEAVAVAAIAGAALTLLLTGLVDGLVLSSTRRRRSAALENDTDSRDTDLDLDFDPDTDHDTDHSSAPHTAPSTDPDPAPDAPEPGGTPPAKHAARRKPVRVFAGAPAPEPADAEHDSSDRGARATEHAE